MSWYEMDSAGSSCDTVAGDCGHVINEPSNSIKGWSIFDELSFWKRNLHITYPVQMLLLK
jgi:hypothetical protein